LNDKAKKKSKVVEITSGSASSVDISPMDQQQILSLEKLAERLLVTPRVVYGLTRARSANPIPFFRVGKALRFYWPHICVWSQSQPKQEYRPRKRRKAA
jgi:hypothetical protein